ncbi:MAG: hypothetical protein LBS99_04080, partial [Clostridiales bacterium]|nr:hypothetical protein [Clostridiales bacterium]
MKRVKLTEFKVKPDDFARLDRVTAARLKIGLDEIDNIRIIKKSMDARDKGDIFFLLSLAVTLKTDKAFDDKNITEYAEEAPYDAPKAKKALK